jgi:hypothetical protein
MSVPRADDVLARLESEIDRAMVAGAAGDKVLNVLTGYSDPWFTGDNQAQSVSLVVPSDDDFYAHSMNVYLAARKFDQDHPTGNATDLTFRPAMWVTTDNGYDAMSGYRVQDANATWKMTDTYNGTYQGETGIKISGAYSARYGQGSVISEIPLTGWPGARNFYVPRKIRRGSTVTFNITPTFSRTVNAIIKAQFRVGVVLLGHKVVRRAA